MSKKAILFLNGDVPPAPILNEAIQQFKGHFTLCADGGYLYARKIPDLKIDAVIGDLDTIRRNHIKIPETIDVIYKPSQELNDFEKALIYLQSNSFNDILLFGSLGGRTDHVLANLAIIQKYSRFCSFRILGTEAEVRFINQPGEYSFPAEPGMQISLISTDKIHIAQTSGLLYPIDNDFLEWPGKLGSSNEATSETVRIRVKGGTMFLFLNYSI